jgi:ribonuclease HI
MGNHAVVIEVYTDGACANNQKAGGQPGGWAAVFTDGREFSGGSPVTTNNQMELTAAIKALEQTPERSHVKIYSDSAYVINGFAQGWLDKWERNGWLNAKGQPVENQDLWKRLRRVERLRHVEWIKVKGHAGHPLNERADRLAVEAIKGSFPAPAPADQQVSHDDRPGQPQTGRESFVTLHIAKTDYDKLMALLGKLAEKYIQVKLLKERIADGRTDGKEGD